VRTACLFPAVRIGGLIILLLLVLAASLFIGRYPQPYWMRPGLLASDELARQLVLSLRLPRVLMAALLGMALSGAGTVMQMIFRNPIVEPGFLGVTQGAAFGVAFGILAFGAGAGLRFALAVLFSLLGLFLSYALARRLRYGGWVIRLVLSGIAVAAFYASGIGLMKCLADPLSQLPEITFWLLGGLWSVTWSDLLQTLPLVIPGLVVLLAMRWRLNVLSLGEDVAASLGISLGWERSLLLLGAVAATAAVTAVAGVIGWVGLCVPHIARRAFGADARLNLPASLLIGAIFTVFCDDLARTLLPGEIPLGILTAVFGAVAFVLLLSTLKVRRAR
jgi:iron complex transport system permease protein